MIKRNRTLLLIGCMLLLLSGCSKPEAVDELLDKVGLGEDSAKETLTMDDVDSSARDCEWIEENSDDCFEEKKHSKYAYKQLSEKEKLWYKDINTLLAYRYDGPLKLDEEGLKQGLDEENVDKIYNAVMIDHPEYFYVDGYEYTVYTRGEKTVGIEITARYTLDKESCLSRMEEIQEAAEDILYYAPETDDDYEKIKYVYETVIYHTDYDMEAEDNQNIYSVLVGDVSVCQGYAKATQYLLNQMDVECSMVYGQVRDGEYHSWNVVKSNGDYYHLDTTWGDASYSVETDGAASGTTPQINYDYLCITTDQITKTHKIKEVVDLPVCDSDEDNYYIREGNYFYEYDTDQLDEVFYDAYDAGSEMVTLKCDSKELYDEFYAKLVDEQQIFEYLYEEYDSISYVENEEQLTMTFWMTK
ncbi:MAG: hypothetical protein IKL22_09975 [Lachnospiraceae bacterium]|nr:hypothetical protein [Lachnospiraceae bacterium]